MNLLGKLSFLEKLTDAGRKEIVDALNKFSPNRRGVSYYATAVELAFYDRDEVITALHKVHERYGTAAVLPLIESLSVCSPEPPPDG
jgi:hypothetical protein